MNNYDKMKSELDQIKSEKQEYINTIEKLNNQINQEKDESKFETIQNTNNDLIKKMISMPAAIRTKYEKM